MTTTYDFTPEMGEISGFGGGYEDACQRMLDAGVKWLLANPEHGNLQAKHIDGVTGIFIPSNKPAEALSEAVIAAVKGEGVTGAMHHVVMQRLFWIANKGWDAYCEEMRKPEEAA